MPDHPGWVWWPGLAGLVYAKHPAGLMVRAHNHAALLARIVAETQRREER